MLERDALLLLSRIYRERTGTGPYKLGKLCGNPRLFGRLEEGLGYHSTSGENAMQWFSDNWPDDLPWPRSVYRPLPRPTPAPKIQPRRSKEATA
jgi:hypothetical protein